jgi:hypothetical protein
MDRIMTGNQRVRKSLNNLWPAASCTLGLALVTAACGGGTIRSGAAVGTIGRGLQAHAHSVPRGAHVCALRAAVDVPAFSHEKPKPMSETCGNDLRSDALWQRAIVVLSAHAAKLDAVASDTDSKTAGQLEAALTGVGGGDSIEVQGASETAARDAITQLVSQMNTQAPKRDLGQLVQDAAAPVKTLCDGLGAYFDAQIQALGELQAQIEEKQASRANRRCGTLDKRTICVSNSTADYLVYANTFGQVAALQSSHLEGRVAIARFCAAHAKLEEAAANGQVSAEQTYGQIIEAVRAVPPAQPPAPAATEEKPAEQEQKKEEAQQGPRSIPSTPATDQK